MADELIPAFCKGVALQQQIRQAKENALEGYFDVWWLGQSGFLIQWNGTCLLFDPYLSDSLTKKYASTNKPHVRLSELVIEPRLLDCIDIVTSSHNHTDHLDGETLIPLLETNPDISFVIPEANRDFIADRIHCDRDFPTGLNDGEQTEVKGFIFHGLPAAHNTIERDESGRSKFMGYVVKFGKFSVYHSGDTLWFDGLDELLKPYGVDVAFLPINGNEPSRGVAGNLSASEAALLGKKIKARFVIPHHYDMFAFNTADPKHFIEEALSQNQSHKVLKLGEKWVVKAMKKISIPLLFMIPFFGFSQNHARNDHPVIASVKYSWENPDKKIKKTILSTKLFEGSAYDMEYLQMGANSLVPSKKKTSLQVPENEEHLLIIKSGSLNISLRDSSWSIGPGSIALLMPAEKYKLQNSTIDPCHYYLMAYRSKLPADLVRGKSSGGSFVKDWNTLEFKTHERGGIRRYFEKATAMCKRFEIHVTTLNDGIKSHEPHTHRAEEIVLVIDNRTEMQIGDKFYKGGTGDVYYLGSNISHAIRNDGKGQCTYFAFQFE